jgi:hypothetical protein
MVLTGRITSEWTGSGGEHPAARQMIDKAMGAIRPSPPLPRIFLFIAVIMYKIMRLSSVKTILSLLKPEISQQ